HVTFFFFFFSSRRRHTRFSRDWSSDVCSSDLADDAQVLGLAGIIGGEDTGSSDETVNVFIECAWFEPTAIAATGRKTGINSDAQIGRASCRERVEDAGGAGRVDETREANRGAR